MTFDHNSPPASTEELIERVAHLLGQWFALPPGARGFVHWTELSEEAQDEALTAAQTLAEMGYLAAIDPIT